MQHPSTPIHSDLVANLRMHVTAAEKDKRLHPEQLRIIYQHKWFKMFVPVHLGGLGLTLPEVLTLEESLSWIDGSLGWAVTLCSGAGWFVGFIDPQVANQFLRDEKFCLAGSGAPTGAANLMGNEYVVDGSWRYASGALHATGFTANCAVQKNGNIFRDENGAPKISAFIFEPSNVRVLDSWNAMGMVGTGSHSFEVSHLRVPLANRFVIDPRNARLTDAVYQYPFLQLAETTLAATLSGMAVRFIDLAEEMFDSASGEKLMKHRTIARTARQTLNEAREMFYERVGWSWQRLLSHNEIDGGLLSEVSSVSHALLQQARAQVNLLYPLCGLRAATLGQDINRVWRDFQTASQHALFVR